MVVEQLEQERQEASKRSQRLQEKLKELQKERDSAHKKASEYKARLAEVKESDRNEMMVLQTKLDKVSLCQSELRYVPSCSLITDDQRVFF